MARDHRETTINIDHDAKLAYIWTTSRRIRSRAARLGAKPCGVWLTLPERCISIRKPAPKRGSAATSGSLAPASQPQSG